MQLCQICRTNQKSSLLTRCCQLFICINCKEKSDRSNACTGCQKSITKKWCEAEDKLFNIIAQYENGKGIQCSRCDNSDNLKYCSQCEMRFCDICNKQVHAVGLYKQHKLLEVSINPSNTKKYLQLRKNSKDQLCMQHRQKKQYICQCNYQHLCNSCLKYHKQTCNRKYKLLSQYKWQYFSMMLNKLQFITECKQHLTATQINYEQHQKKQKQLYLSTQQLMIQAFDKLQKLLQYKKTETLRHLDTYWQDCCTVFQRNLQHIKVWNSQYDDYGRLIQRLSDKMIGLQWLDKHVVKKGIQFERFAIKIGTFDNLQRQIMNLGVNSKKWQTPFQNIQSTGIRVRKSSLANLQNPNPLLLSQVNDNPLLPRPLVLQASSTQIQYQFLHLPYQKNEYQIQFGVGFKAKGQQVFKRLKANQNGKGIIKGLNSGTTYRVRMRVLNGGNWGTIHEITTLQPNAFLTLNCPFAKSETKGSIMFLRSGTLYAVNPIQFGIHTWQIKTVLDKNSHSESQTACISIGVSNRQTKKGLFVGTTINYGYQRDNIRIRVVLDCQNNKMTITNFSANDNMKQQQQIYQTLPQFPLFATIINKGNSTVQLFINF